MLAAGKSDIGKVRNQNQDSIYISEGPIGPLPNLFIVADGMGGHNAGDVASKQAVELFCNYIKNNTAETADFLDLCVSAATHANTGIRKLACENPDLNGMGTTFSACYIVENQCQIVHIGDSRVYLVTPEYMTQLTNDHSFVNEMVKAGQLTPTQAREHPKRNVLLRVLGGADNAEVDGYARGLEGACAVLLCSDGLIDMLTDNEIFNICNKKTPAEERVQELINAANAMGGRDNISAIIIDIT